MPCHIDDYIPKPHGSAWLISNLAACIGVASWLGPVHQPTCTILYRPNSAACHASIFSSIFILLLLPATNTQMIASPLTWFSTHHAPQLITMIINTMIDFFDFSSPQSIIIPPPQRNIHADGAQGCGHYRLTRFLACLARTCAPADVLVLLSQYYHPTTSVCCHRSISHQIKTYICNATFHYWQ